MPSTIQLAIKNVVEVFDEASGLIGPPVQLTSVPAIITGGTSGSYPAGTGLRVNWKTGTIHGRRLLKGCSYAVPGGNLMYAASGAIDASVQVNVDIAAAAYLASMSTAALQPVVWHRPAKHTFSGGTSGTIISGSCSRTPAGLRSRRS
jgi:hypothetical protein